MTAQAPGAPVRPAAGGSWAGRPAGMPGGVPPPSLPLGFLAASALGLVACGALLIWSRRAGVADPTADPVVAAAHLGMLATLSMGVLGAVHQFTPVVTQRPLRSAGLGRATFVTWLAAAWLLPFGIAAEQEAIVETGGAFAAIAITLLVVNLWSPLSARGKGAPVTGLRLALAGLVATASFGVVYVADRQGNWFGLAGHVVLAHAVVGLFAWLGLTYVSVGQKLWPMFFLAHVPGRHRAGQVAVWTVPGGVVLLSPGLLAGLSWLAWAGGAVLAAGLGAHLVSLAVHVRHRRRKADLHLVFVLTAAAWLVAGAGLALAAGLVMPGDHHAGMALAAAAVVAFAGWLLEALVGHAHKVVPFIMWSVLRARGVTTTGHGRQIGFADLYDHRWAVSVYGLVTAGLAALAAGYGVGSSALIGAGGVLLIVAALGTTVNLSLTPALMLGWLPRPQRPASGHEHTATEEGHTATEEEHTATEEEHTGTGRGSPASGDGAPVAGLAQSSRVPPGRGGPDRHGLTATVSWIAIAAAGVAVLMAASALWAGRPKDSGASAAAASAPVVPNGKVKNFNIELGDLFVRPSSISVSYGTRVVLHVSNTGGMDHDLQLEGGRVGTGMLSPGQHTSVSYGVFGHTEQAWCTVPGHKAAGMVLTIRVHGAPPASGAVAAGAGSAAGSPSRDAVINFGAKPGPGWRPFNAALAPAPGGTVHHVTLVARDKEMQVAPGVTQDEWTFNGRVPGPTLRGHVGDVFVVTLVNRTRMDHSLDFHAASAPMEDMDSREVAPGHSYTFRFRAAYAGIFLYHCGTTPILEHLANGMFGAVIIDPPHLAPVAHEFLIVQSELYLGPQRKSGDYAKMLSGQPSAVVFNEYVNQYLFSPLRVLAGQRVRIWVLDAGPSDDSSFHVVGAQFDTVFSNGTYLVRPHNSADTAAQTLNVMPGEGGFVEFTAPAPGHYLMVDHHLDHGTTGAAGYLVAGKR